jgi:hypothetical protein
MSYGGKIKPTYALLLFVLALALLNSLNQYQQTKQQARLNDPEIFLPEGGLAADWRFAEAFKTRQSNVQLTGEGKIERLLPDDNRGTRHQKILVRLESGQSLLLVHNIDVAQRLRELNLGESIEFAGEYEWNAQGGLLHWTHHDPQGRHADGWIKYQGQVYR